jgi:hypothetical protein
MVADALSFEPQKKVSGTYSRVNDNEISKTTETNAWTSDDDGLV